MSTWEWQAVWCHCPSWNHCFQVRCSSARGGLKELRPESFCSRLTPSDSTSAAREITVCTAVLAPPPPVRHTCNQHIGSSNHLACCHLVSRVCQEALFGSSSSSDWPKNSKHAESNHSWNQSVNHDELLITSQSLKSHLWAQTPLSRVRVPLHDHPLYLRHDTVITRGDDSRCHQSHS